MRKIKLLMAAAFCLCLFRSEAQEHDPAVVINELKQVAKSYQQAGQLSFDVSYYYASETSPSVYLDSLKGNCKISGAHYWYSLDSTEMLYSDQYVVILYKEDKVMYLAKPSEQLKNANPLTMLDSFLAKNENLRYNMAVNGKLKIITIDVAGGGSPGKRIEYYIDAATGLLVKMVNIVRAEELYDPSVRSQVQAGAYAIVETRFANYETRPTEDAVFNTNRYFTKEGGRYVVTASYDSYKIFLSNPGL